ncbi:MAG: NAD-dependent epimerase/dehydratase family protein, partial [Acidimicrobiales bacterium]
MRVVVAGGAGLIGASMCTRLVERGDDVVCLDNLVTGSADNLKGLVGRERFRFVEADITGGNGEPGWPADAFGRGLDAVVNLACPASPADFGPLSLEILDTGSRGVANLLDLARRHGARYLQASTSE